MIHEVHDPFFLHVTPVWRPSFAQSPGRPRPWWKPRLSAVRTSPAPGILVVSSHWTHMTAQGGVCGWQEQRLSEPRVFAPLRCCSHTCRKSTFNLADFSLVFQPRSPYVPKMSAALSVKPAMEFLLAHECRFNLFAFASDLYQHNEVWDLMGSCQNQIPLTLIPAPCSV